MSRLQNEDNLKVLILGPHMAMAKPPKSRPVPNIDPITKQAIPPISPMMETTIPVTDKKHELLSRFK